MSELQVFKFEEMDLEISITEIDGEPYFIGKEIAERLGYNDTSQAIRKHVDEEDKLTRQINASGQNRDMTMINESGFYSLVLKSKLEVAKKFKRWVTSEVLPMIRKHGGYITETKLDEIANNPDLLIKLATNLKEEQQKRKEAELLALEKQKVIEIQQPKAEFVDGYVEADGLYKNDEAAKVLKIGRNKMLEWLRQEKIFMTGNVPYQRYIDSKWFEVKIWNKGSFSGSVTLFTSKGLFEISKKLDEYRKVIKIDI